MDKKEKIEGKTFGVLKVTLQLPKGGFRAVCTECGAVETYTKKALGEEKCKVCKQ